MFHVKELDFGVIIISPENNLGKILSSIRCLKNRFPKNNVICVVCKSINSGELSQINVMCPTHKGGDTFTSLINTGLKKGNKNWNLIIVEGTTLPRCIDARYSKFIEDEKDIVFPVVVEHNIQGYPVQIHNTFYDCTLNGIMVHRNVIKEVGEMDNGDLEKSRILWAAKAIDKGYRFKGIFGCKF